MVFSRYATVLRGTGYLLRSNLLETKHNPKTAHRRAANFRTCTNHARCQPEISQNTGEASGAMPASHDVPVIRPKIISFTSPRPLNWNSKPSRINASREKSTPPDEIMTEEELDAVTGLPGALEPCTEDISHIKPYQLPSFNFASYANSSPTIQELAKLGVELWKVEAKPNGMKVLLSREFEEMKPYIRFLHDAGVPAEGIGTFITDNPFIFTQDIDDLHTRIRYLMAHKFSRHQVARIMNRNPFWLMFATKKIDERLGHFQKEFRLNGPQVRSVAESAPRLITHKMSSIVENTFGFREEMGFNKNEVKAIIVKRPALFMKPRKTLVPVFDYIHNTMKLSHEILAKLPMILTCRLERLRNRHDYLVTLGRNQYDPTKPLYVSPDAIVGGTDQEFCRDVAKTTVGTYNIFLKTR